MHWLSVEAWKQGSSHILVPDPKRGGFFGSILKWEAYIKSWMQLIPN